MNDNIVSPNQIVRVNTDLKHKGAEYNINMGVVATEYEGINFIQVVANSQYFNNIQQIHEYIRITSGDEYLIKAIENTIEMGYQLKLKSEE